MRIISHRRFSLCVRVIVLISFCVHIVSPMTIFAEEIAPENKSVVLPEASASASSSSFIESSEPFAFAQGEPVSVVISEVMWMGSNVSTADEWVEIVGTGIAGSLESSPRSLSGWTLRSVKDGGIEAVIATFSVSATIGSGQYLVVSNYSKEVSRLAIDPAVTSTAMSVPNTKLLLRLRDASGALMDEVDDGVGNPFAGLNPSGGGTKASMERMDLQAAGTLPSNWTSATESRGFDDGAPMFGTPGFARSRPAADRWEMSSASSFPSSSSSSSTGVVIISSSAVSFSSAISSNISSSSIHVQPYMKLKIHELLSNPIGSDDAEWIEVKNHGSDPVNLSGMTIRVGTAGHRVRGSSFAAAPKGTPIGSTADKSGSVVDGGGLIVIPKSAAGFTLSNNGATVQLLSGSTVIDTFTYPSYPEGVSAGRDDAYRLSVTGYEGEEISPFCVPTPGVENRIVAPDPRIIIQSGNLTGQDPVTLNLTVEAASGSLAGGSCHFDFGDGYLSDSCNPASHTMKTIGDYTINMVFTDYCGTTVTRSLTGAVAPKSFSVRASGVQAKGSVATACIPSAFSGVSITELLPNPSGEEEDGEWIELRNDTEKGRSLCGWFLDDGPGGSRPFSLAAHELPPHSVIALPRNQSKIALNNDSDIARLIAPLPAGGTGALQTVLYNNAPDDQSYAVNGSGSWIWTPHATPGAQNRFQEASSVFKSSAIRLSAAFPNPKGPDTWDEWIEISNTAGWPIWLNGWVIRNAQGKELDLTGTVLPKLSTKKIYLSRLKFILGNEQETLQLLDQEGVVRSILSWKNAKEEVTQKQFISPEKKQSVLVRQIVDGNTLLVQSGDDPESLQRVRLLGVALPLDSSVSPEIASLKIKKEYFIRSLILNKKVDLEFDSIDKNEEGILQAYLWRDGVNIQQELLVRGLAAVDPTAESSRLQEYEVYESMARSLKEGLWQSEILTAFVETQKEEADRWNALQTRGLTLKADQPEGLIASGTMLQLLPNQPSDLYVSINGNAFSLLSGSILLASNQTIRAYAEARFTGRDPVRSAVLQKTFIADTKAPKRAVRISEVYPSPLAGEVEWIELENRTAMPVSLGGWQLDDEAGKGSKPWMIPADVHIPAYGRLLFPMATTKLSLSNSGDEVRLLYPTGKVADSIAFKSVKKGRAVAWNSLTASICLTDAPTPLELNTCFIQNKKSVQKKAKEKVQKKKSYIIKNLEVSREKNMASMRNKGLYDSLLAQTSGYKNIEAYVSVFTLKDLFILCLVALSGFGILFWFRKKS